jgi:amidohydrolase
VSVPEFGQLFCDVVPTLWVDERVGKMKSETQGVTLNDGVEIGLIPEILAAHDELTKWRRDIHAHPELAFEESRTAGFIAHRLEEAGIDVARGLGKTGLVGTLRSGSSERVIGLRADMDALPMDELNELEHKSRHVGRMHACGHDGHTVMLLAAARHLAATRHFDGTVRFIFQPAEEANARGSGAEAMIAGGLFDRFAMSNVFAIHNLPQLAAGTFAVRAGPVLAAMDLFDVAITGHGTHGATPHKGVDSIWVAAQLINAWQSIVSPNIDPLQSAVVSATSIIAGDSWNVIPETATIRGSIRTLRLDLQKLVKARFFAIAEHVAEAYGAKVVIKYREMTPVLINDPDQVSVVCEAAAQVVGEDKVSCGFVVPQAMGSDDFSLMLAHAPGAYVFLGTGDGKKSRMLHEPQYDFNDEILPIGASFWVRLVERKLEV